MNKSGWQGSVYGWILLLGVMVLTLGGCKAAEDQTGGQTLGGLTYSVVAGSVTHPTSGSVAAGVGGAFILFDATIDSLVTVPSKLNVIVTLTLQDGGSADLFAFGDPADPTAGILGAGLARSGVDVSYRSYVTDPTTPWSSAIINPLNVPADGTLHLTADLHSDLVGDSYTWGSVIIWPPEVTAPDTCLGEYYAADEPTYVAAGNRFGISFAGATLQSISVTDAVDPTCF